MRFGVDLAGERGTWTEGGCGVQLPELLLMGGCCWTPTFLPFDREEGVVSG